MLCLGQGLLSQIPPPAGPCAPSLLTFSFCKQTPKSLHFQIGKLRLKKGQSWHLNKRRSPGNETEVLELGSQRKGIVSQRWGLGHTKTES